MTLENENVLLALEIEVKKMNQEKIMSNVTCDTSNLIQKLDSSCGTSNLINGSDDIQCVSLMV